MTKVIVYCDGACSGNPGPGGWGLRMEFDGEVVEANGGERNTTNNRMELMAAIETLARLPAATSEVVINTDSKYVIEGLTKWLPRWKLNRWRNAKKQPVANADLWQRLDELAKKKTPKWNWIKAHAGHPGNERADELARGGIPL